MITPMLAPVDLAAATLVRPGDAATVERLRRIGARIVCRGSHRDSATGTIWPCIVVRLGRARVVIVLASAEGATPTTPGQHHVRAPGNDTQIIRGKEKVMGAKCPHPSPFLARARAA